MRLCQDRNGGSSWGSRRPRGETSLGTGWDGIISDIMPGEALVLLPFGLVFWCVSVVLDQHFECESAAAQPPCRPSTQDCALSVWDHSDLVPRGFFPSYRLLRRENPSSVHCRGKIKLPAHTTTTSSRATSAFGFQSFPFSFPLFQTRLADTVPVHGWILVVHDPHFARPHV